MEKAFKYRALVVDDEAVLRQLAIRSLSNLGIHCDMACDGESALKWAARHRYDLIVSDLRLPGMNGHTLCLNLLDRRGGAEPGSQPAICVVTAVDNPKIIKDLHARGVDRVTLKPVDYCSWAKEMQTLLENRTAAPELAPTPDIGTRGGGANSQATSHCVVVLTMGISFSTSMALKAADYDIDVVVAVSTDHLLELVETKRIDLLIMDQKLSGFLTGDQIVSRLHSELINLPAFLRVEDKAAHSAMIDEIDGVERLIPFETQPEELLEIAQRYLGQLSRSRLMLDSTARKLVAEFSEVPPIPHVLARLAHYLAEPATEISIPKLASEIQKDSRLTSELIKVANSAQVATTSRQNDLKSIITLLGPRQAILMCLSIGLRTVRSQLMKPWADDFRDWYLKRSALVAATAESCAKHLEDVPSETAFLLGVLTDIGVLVLAEHHGQKYFDRVIQRFRTIPTLQLVNSERLVTNTDHSMVTAAVLESWKFPFSIVQPIYAQHQNMDDTLPKMGAGLVRCLRLGEAFAEMCDNPVAQRVGVFNQLLSKYYDVSRLESRHVFLEAIEKANLTAEILRTPPLEMSELESIINHEAGPVPAIT